MKRTKRLCLFSTVIITAISVTEPFVVNSIRQGSIVKRSIFIHTMDDSRYNRPLSMETSNEKSIDDKNLGTEVSTGSKTETTKTTLEGKDAIAQPTDSSIVRRPLLSNDEVYYYLTIFPLISLIITFAITCWIINKRTPNRREHFTPMRFHASQVAKNIINFKHPPRFRNDRYEADVGFIREPLSVENVANSLGPNHKLNSDSSDDESSSDMTDDYPFPLLEKCLADDYVRSPVPFERLKRYSSNDYSESSDDDDQLQKESVDKKAVDSMNIFHPIYAYAAVSPDKTLEDILEDLPKKTDLSLEMEATERLIINKAIKDILKYKGILHARVF